MPNSRIGKDMLTLVPDEDLDLIFSRFGKIISCEVIREKRTGDSLQYAFIEFEDQKACEQAYFKMQGVLIDDHRIHVDFSQSVRTTIAWHNKLFTDCCQVSRLSDTWRTATNSKRKNQTGGFGGAANLEKKRQYRAVDAEPSDRKRDHGRYDMVLNKHEVRSGRYQDSDRRPTRRYNSRSRSPRRRDLHGDPKSRQGDNRPRRRRT